MPPENKFAFVREKISATPTFYNMFLAADNRPIRTLCRNSLHGLVNSVGLYFGGFRRQHGKPFFSVGFCRQPFVMGVDHGGRVARLCGGQVLI